jgi:CubicO group peptidase (beta-lactamase class C family)
MRETFFAPVGGGAELAEPLRRRIAATENCPWRERIVWGEVHDPNAWAMGGIAGHAGLFSTADDVMRFAQTVLDVWHGRSEALPRAQLQAFSERQQLPKGSDWALGWDTPTLGQSSSGRYFSARSIGHLGFTGTSLWIDLEREAVVVMLTNRVHQVAKKSRFELRPIVHDLVMEGFLAEAPPRPPKATDDE